MDSIRFILYPYSLSSKSAKDLSNALGCKRVRRTGSYQHRAGELIINWGNSQLPAWGDRMAIRSMLNKPQYVANASGKLATFNLLGETDLRKYLPEWTTSRATARQWLERTNPYGTFKQAVVCRTLTRANSGRGIVFADTPNEVVPAPLYTLYKPKQSEFRIHVHSRFGIMDIQQKRRRNNASDTNSTSEFIRSWNNDWIFARENVKCPERVQEVAELAISRLGLDFGAVDIGYHSICGIGLYEVNTAPGIEGQTLTNYVNAFKRYLQT